MTQYPIITLLTDFGLSDPYVGIMKGIIEDISPNSRIIDLTHLIPPQNVRAGSLALERSYKYFPAGTIHLAVINSGVGSNRHALVMRAEHYLFVGPDNGLFSFVIQRAREKDKKFKVYRLENPRYRLEPVSPIFHGREMFAPAAAYLAAGAAVEEFGEVIPNPVILGMPAPEPSSGGWMGEVWAIDHFGSLETNLDSKLLFGCNPKMIKIRIKGKIIDHWVSTFSEGNPGELVALVDSADRLTICMVNGNAASVLGAGMGTPVELILNG
jgi:S-adenosylmethionine hydrolase